MRIYINDFPDADKGRIVKAVEIDRNASYNDLTDIILKTTNIKESLYFLSFNGKTMENHAKLSELGVGDNSFIRFSLKQIPADSLQVLSKLYL